MRERLSYANVMATIAVFLALGGGAYAAIDLVGRNDIKSKHIAKNAVKGKDVAEASLARVPEAAVAVTAASADRAASADSASRVNGLSVVKIDYRRNVVAPPETILDLAGLKIQAACPALGYPEASATTTKQDSSLYGFGIYPPNLDQDSFDYEGGAFDPGTPVDLDAELGNIGDPRIGSLVYEAPDGAVVTVDFAGDRNGTSDCVITGTAIGG